MDNTKALFNVYSSDMQEYLQELNSKQKDVKKYRQKTIVSGKMLEVDIYPVWNLTKGEIDRRTAKDEKHKEYVAHNNFVNRQKNVIRILNANFDEKGICLGLGFKTKDRDEHGRMIQRELTREEARKETENYKRRLRERAKKLDYEEFKAFYVIEQFKGGGYHVHFVTNFKDRDIAEQLWKGGQYPQSRRLMPDDDFALTGLAIYVAKDCKDGKGYYATRNLTKPWQKAKVRDNKISKHKCKQIYNENINAREYFESKFPQYEFLDIEKKTSSFVEGYYFYVRMRKKDDKIINKPHKRKSKRKRE